MRSPREFKARKLPNQAECTVHQGQVEGYVSRSTDILVVLWRSRRMSNDCKGRRIAATLIYSQTGYSFGEFLSSDETLSKGDLDMLGVYLRMLSAVLALSVSGGASFAQTTVVNRAATQAAAIELREALAAQRAWCDALVNISTTHARQGGPAARALAERVIDAAYGYQMGAVLFKPTLTVAPQTFRPTRAGALAYFVGGDTAFPNDKGFALGGWTKCEIANNAIFINGNTATTIGNVSITGPNGAVTTVDKTWVFVKDDAGNLRIIVHHSSLPHRPN